MGCDVTSCDVTWWWEVMSCDAMRWDGTGCDVVVMRCGCEMWRIRRWCAATYREPVPQQNPWDVHPSMQNLLRLRRAGVTAQLSRSSVQCVVQRWDAKQNKTTPSQSASKKIECKMHKVESIELENRNSTATTPGKCPGTENVPKVLCLPGTNREAQNRMARMEASMTKRRGCSARRKRLTRK